MYPDLSFIYIYVFTYIFNVYIFVMDIWNQLICWDVKYMNDLAVILPLSLKKL